jgi:Tol biopolymer transport system component
LNNYRNVSLTTNGGSLVTVLSEGISNVWVAPVGDANRAAQITSNRFDGIGGIAWTPDGRIVRVSRASGNADIWIMNADGTEDRQLTSNALLNLVPRVSPDGHYMVFMSNRTGSTNIWRMDLDGNNPKQLLTGLNGWNPLCTNDSQSVIFTSDVGGKPSLWKVSIDGGSPVKLTDYYAMGLDISPKDGRIAFRFIDEQAKPPRFRTTVISSDGGPPTAVFDFPEFFGTIGPGFFGQSIGWTVDGRALTYIDTKDGVSNIWAQPIDGSSKRQLTNFKSDLIFYYAWSRDGKKLALARGSKTSDVVLITDLTNAQ